MFDVLRNPQNSFTAFSHNRIEKVGVVSFDDFRIFWNCFVESAGKCEDDVLNTVLFDLFGKFSASKSSTLATLELISQVCSLCVAHKCSTHIEHGYHICSIHASKQAKVMLNADG